MTALRLQRARRPESFTDKAATTGRSIGVYGVAVSMALALSGLMLAVSTVFAIGDDTSDAVVLGVTAVICGPIGLFGLRSSFSSAHLRPVATMTATILAFVVVIALSTILYLITGSLSRIDDALYESVAGVSTSALTVLEDPAVLSDGVLVWRAATQWLGGFGALTLAVGLLPFLGGSRELAGGPQARNRVKGVLATRPLPAIKRVAAIYAVVTIGVGIAFGIAGMGARDAVAHSFSTVSTGGFSTHAESFAFFDNVAIEMVAIVAMLGAGSSAAFAWLLWRRAFGDTRRAFELQVYLLVVSAASLWIWWLRHNNENLGLGRGFREALFTVTSVMTTTGHRIDDWGSWHPGAATLLLLLLVVGGTAGSVAGGLRWIRVVGMAQFVWRELQRQLHPRSIRSVKVGRTTISEASVDRMHAQMVYVMTLGAFASLVLALFGEGITEAITLTLSAISTTGPGFDDAGGIFTAAELTRPERAVLMPVMLTGRVFLYPAFVAVGAGFSTAARALKPQMTRLGVK